MLQAQADFVHSPRWGVGPFSKTLPVFSDQSRPGDLFRLTSLLVSLSSRIEIKWDNGSSRSAPQHTLALSLRPLLPVRRTPRRTSPSEGFPTIAEALQREEAEGRPPYPGTSYDENLSTTVKAAH